MKCSLYAGLSAMLAGSDGVKVVEYKAEEVETILQEYFRN